MRYAAICEDEKEILGYLRRQLQEQFKKNHFEITFSSYLNGTDLLSSISAGEKYDLLFLDIEMPGINGIEVCRKLRSLNSDILIIFISNKEELVFQTFEVRPFRFIRKNHFQEELPQLVKDIQNEFKGKTGYTLTIKEQNSSNVYSLNLNDIVYIEVIGKLCKIVTTSENYTLRYKLADFEKLLSDKGFLHPHRSYLVNYRYIFSIKKDHLLLDNQMQIPLSRKRIDTIKNQFIILSQGGQL